MKLCLLRAEDAPRLNAVRQPEEEWEGRAGKQSTGFEEVMAKAGMRLSSFGQDHRRVEQEGCSSPSLHSRMLALTYQNI